MTDRHEALVQAAREAMLNAARHGGGTVSVYLESTAGSTEIFIKDRGTGFDLMLSRMTGWALRSRSSAG